MKSQWNLFCNKKLFKITSQKNQQGTIKNNENEEEILKQEDLFYSKSQ